MSPSVSVRLLQSQSDERLVGYARAGHERAFEALVQRYRRQLLNYCRRLLLSDQRAEDAVQQALLQAWVALRDGNEVTEPRAWLYRIVHNTAVNTLRTSRYDYCQLSESLSGADAPQADLDRRIAVREALAGLAALPEMQREALLRTAVEGRSHQQTAADLGLSEPAVRGLVYRARASLRAAVSAIMPPPLIGWALATGTGGAPVLERVAGLGAGGGSAGLVGLIVKGGAVVVSAGALAGGIVATHAHHASGHHRRGGRPQLSEARHDADVAIGQPVAFARSGGVTRTPRPQPASGAAPPVAGARGKPLRREDPPPATHRQTSTYSQSPRVLGTSSTFGDQQHPGGGAFGQPTASHDSGKESHGEASGRSPRNGKAGNEQQDRERSRGGGLGESDHSGRESGEGKESSSGGDRGREKGGGSKDHGTASESSPRQDN